VEVVKLNSLKPLDLDTIERSVRQTGRILVVEDQLKTGAIGQQVLAGLSSRGVQFAGQLLNLEDRFIPHGTVDELLDVCKLNTPHILKKLLNMVASDEKN